jgi:hypothetical protein
VRDRKQIAASVAASVGLGPMQALVRGVAVTKEWPSRQVLSSVYATALPLLIAGQVDESGGRRTPVACVSKPSQQKTAEGLSPE